MNLLVETVEEKQKALIVSEKNYPFIALLKKEIERYGLEVFYAPFMPKNKSTFDYYFFINQKHTSYDQLPKTYTKLITILLNRSYAKQNDFFAAFLHHRIIEIRGDDIRKEHIDRLFWFAFSKTKERYLREDVGTIAVKKKLVIPKLIHKIVITKKRILFAVVVLFILAHVAFLPPLAFSLFETYNGFKAFKAEQMDTAKNRASLADAGLQVSKQLYSLARPTLGLFFISQPTDTLMDTGARSSSVLDQSIVMVQNAKQVQKLLFKTGKTKEEKAYLMLRINEFETELKNVDDNATVLVQLLPPQLPSIKRLRAQMANAIEGMDRVQKIFPYLDSILANNTEKKYLLFFANNMELRPGGGFLGSFGVLTVKDYTIENIKIHDVYDADGQLKAHIDPPDPIRVYLHIPHGFLRDSNFSPDFPENYAKAKMFLEKEINLTGFSGSFLITTTAIQRLLGAFGNIYLPDYDETINQQNFYLKAQMHAENDFFPGSIQKRSFLGTLARYIFVDLDSVSLEKIALAFKQSLDEKQLLVYFDDSNIQKAIDPFYWSGRVIEPKCAFESKGTCIIDYLLPFDANVGANKANYYITRSMYLKTDIDPNGQISHVFSVRYHNDSPGNVFPGGTYKNYFQTMVPVGSAITSITRDGTLVENFDQKNTAYKTIGFYFELPPGKTTEIKIQYVLNQRISSGNSLYQLVVQKQIGSPNSDYVLEMTLPKNLSIVNQNFTPLVKENHIVYNTTLSADKIFFVELAKNQ